MYLSNSRLISLFLALLVLTLSLLWLLGNKVNNISVSSALNTSEPVQLVARQPETTAVENVVSSIPSLEPAKETIPPASEPEALVSTQSTDTPKPVNTAAAKITEVAAIPDNLVLSEKELKALSTKERKHYEKMMENLRSLRQQSTQLTSERQRLEQQMTELEQRNQELTKQLEAMRQATDTSVATSKP